MVNKNTLVIALLATLVAACTPSVSITPASTGAEASTRVVFIAGRDSHGFSAHEHKAGSELLARALQERRPDIETVNVYGGWPEDESILDTASAIVMYCDGGEKHLVSENLSNFNRLVKRGVGVVALHYCVEVPKGSPSAESLVDAIGGYFETDWSVNPHWKASMIQPPQHPTAKGVEPFTQLDEWYFNMRFAPQGITPVLSAVPPLETVSRPNGSHSGNDAVRKMVAEEQPQVLAWAFERPRGGRGFGFTGGHFHSGWDEVNAKAVVLNAIEWVAEPSHVAAE